MAEDGRELYMQSSVFSPLIVSEWVKEHVLPQLPLCPHKRYSGENTVFGDHIDHFARGQCTFSYKGENKLYHYPNCFWRTRAQMKQELLTFMDSEKYGKTELWGYYSAYDHVAFCQLFGTMMDLPEGYPMYTRDIKQWCDQLGNPKLPEQGKGEHNALADARHNRVMYEFLAKFEQEKYANSK